MRVVTLQELGDCPPGTIFSDYEPCIVRELYRLGDIIRHRGEATSYNTPGEVTDFFYMGLLAEPGDGAWLAPGDDPRKGWSCADSWGRWGCFEKEALFVVYEEEDLTRLVNALTTPVEFFSNHREAGYKGPDVNRVSPAVGTMIPAVDPEDGVARGGWCVFDVDIKGRGSWAYFPYGDDALDAARDYRRVQEQRRGAN